MLTSRFVVPAIEDERAASSFRFLSLSRIVSLSKSDAWILSSSNVSVNGRTTAVVPPELAAAVVAAVVAAAAAATAIMTVGVRLVWDEPFVVSRFVVVVVIGVVIREFCRFGFVLLSNC